MEDQRNLSKLGDLKMSDKVFKWRLIMSKRKKAAVKLVNLKYIYWLKDANKKKQIANAKNKPKNKKQLPNKL